MNIRLSLFLLTLLPLAVGCGESKDKLTLFCGAGIRPAAAELAETFNKQNNVNIECDYAGSEMLLAKIKVGKKGDLYMPGDVHYVEQAEEAGLISSKANACYFIPVILVQKGNPKNIKSLADLKREDVKLGLGDPKACAIGRKCSKIFKKNGIDENELNVEFRSMTVNELGTNVKLGTLDAVIVWDATAAYFAGDVDVVPIPIDQNVISTVSIGVLKSSKHPEVAEKFVQFATSEQGRKIFEKHNYTVDKPE